VIARKIEALKESPEKQGKALSGDLGGYRSLHAAGRYKVVYEVKANEVTVIVVAVGMRKEGSGIDGYETLKKLLRSKVLE
jgi:mRNA interferase RelE/StbE